jgi:membrane fusion protein, heavy metal efflux system
MARWGRLVLGGLLGCLGAAALVVGLILFQDYRKAQAGAATEVAAGSGDAHTGTAKAPRPTRIGPDTLEIPPEVVQSLDVHTAPAAAATRSRPLPPFTGVLALDNDRLARVHTRFGGEVVALGTPAGKETSELPSPGSSGPRPLAVGDSVRKGQLLAIVWSKDLGEKKSELIDSLVKLRADQKIYDELQSLFAKGGTAERAVRDAEVAVQSDRNAVSKAERTLRSWRLTDAEIAVIRDEAERLNRAPDGRAEDAAWARVEVRAPLDGTILEKNVNFGDVVDTTSDLFKVADRSQLAVWVHVFEEDLPRLQDPTLPRPLPWTVRVPAMPGVTFAGHLERIADVIDPNQHTALAIGHVENPNGLLKAGQFVSVTVELPAASNEIEVPATALVEDGRESIVFVQPDPDKLRFTRRKVKVLRRSHDLVNLAQGAVRSGDRVVTGGAIFLNDALTDLPMD